jgi:2-C-methyl-D-erythritol 4-phosphate cytidylyltransferase
LAVDARGGDRGGGGRGERLGHALPKAFVPLRGRSLLGHAVAALAASDRVDAVLPVLPRGMAPPRDAAHAKLLPAVPGGERRQDSVAAGLARRCPMSGGMGMPCTIAARPRRAGPAGR